MPIRAYVACYPSSLATHTVVVGSHKRANLETPHRSHDRPGDCRMSAFTSPELSRPDGLGMLFLAWPMIWKVDATGVANCLFGGAEMES